MSVIQFPTAGPGKLRPTPAASGDLIVGALKVSGDFGVLTVAEVDDDRAVATCLDVDGKRIAISRLFDLTQNYFIASRKLLTARGRVVLPGLCSPALEDIKAAFREHAEVRP